MIDRHHVAPHVRLVMALLVINLRHALLLDGLSRLLGDNLLVRLLRLVRYARGTDHVSRHHVIDLRVVHLHRIDIGLLLVMVNHGYLLSLNRIHVLDGIEIVLTWRVASLANLMHVDMILTLLSLRNHGTLVLMLQIFNHAIVCKLKHFLVILWALLWNSNTRTVS